MQTETTKVDAALDLAQELESRHEELEEAVERFNEVVADAWTDVKHAQDQYNDTATDFENALDELNEEDLQSISIDKSDLTEVSGITEKTPDSPTWVVEEIEDLLER